MQAKDATSASKKNYLSSTNFNYHHSINVKNMYCHATTNTKHYCVTIEQSIEIFCHALMQVCKLYKWWLWIFFTKSSEWAITKQACKDESIVSVFLLSDTYRPLLLYIKHCTTEKLKHRLPICISMYNFKWGTCIDRELMRYISSKLQSTWQLTCQDFSLVVAIVLWDDQ